MKSVFELVSKHIEPSIKRLLVEALIERGLSRVEIAKYLGISQSLITRYLKRERGLHDLSVFRDVSSIVNELANRIASGELRETTEIYYEVLKIIIYILSKKYACGIHYSIDKSINPARCNICPDLFNKLMY